MARPDEIQAAENIRRLLRALTGVPPQEVHDTGPTSLPLRDGRIPVTVGDSAREYVFDTGANLSTIMRSEAEGLGLDIRPAGLRVGTSTDAVITADVGIANRLTIGSIDVRNAIFLVLADSLLTFPDNSRITGIIGFPVIAARARSGYEPPASW